MSDVDQLVAALDAAPDDTARLALLNAAPRRVREGLKAQLFYLKFMADTHAACEAERVAFETFAAQLDAAPSDDVRLAIIQAAEADPARGRAWLSEWSWRQGATTDHWQRRYLAMACYGEKPLSGSEL